MQFKNARTIKLIKLVLILSTLVFTSSKIYSETRSQRRARVARDARRATSVERRRATRERTELASQEAAYQQLMEAVHPELSTTTDDNDRQRAEAAAQAKIEECLGQFQDQLRRVLASQRGNFRTMVEKRTDIAFLRMAQVAVDMLKNDRGSREPHHSLGTFVSKKLTAGYARLGQTVSPEELARTEARMVEFYQAMHDQEQPPVEGEAPREPFQMDAQVVRALHVMSQSRTVGTSHDVFDGMGRAGNAFTGATSAERAAIMQTTETDVFLLERLYQVGDNTSDRCVRMTDGAGGEASCLPADSSVAGAGTTPQGTQMYDRLFSNLRQVYNGGTREMANSHQQAIWEQMVGDVDGILEEHHHGGAGAGDSHAAETSAEHAAHSGGPAVPGQSPRESCENDPPSGRGGVWEVNPANGEGECRMPNYQHARRNLARLTECQMRAYTNHYEAPGTDSSTFTPDEATCSALMSELGSTPMGDPNSDPDCQTVFAALYGSNNPFERCRFSQAFFEVTNLNDHIGELGQLMEWLGMDSPSSDQVGTGTNERFDMSDLGLDPQPEVKNRELFVGQHTCSIRQDENGNFTMLLNIPMEHLAYTSPLGSNIYLNLGPEMSYAQYEGGERGDSIERGTMPGETGTRDQYQGVSPATCASLTPDAGQQSGGPSCRHVCDGNADFRRTQGGRDLGGRSDRRRTGNHREHLGSCTDIPIFQNNGRAPRHTDQVRMRVNLGNTRVDDITMYSVSDDSGPGTGFNVIGGETISSDSAAQQTRQTRCLATRGERNDQVSALRVEQAAAVAAGNDTLATSLNGQISDKVDEISGMDCEFAADTGTIQRSNTNRAEMPPLDLAICHGYHTYRDNTRPASDFSLSMQPRDGFTLTTSSGGGASGDGDSSPSAGQPQQCAIPSDWQPGQPTPSCGVSLNLSLGSAGVSDFNGSVRYTISCDNEADLATLQGQLGSGVGTGGRGSSIEVQPADGSDDSRPSLVIIDDIDENVDLRRQSGNCSYQIEAFDSINRVVGEPVQGELNEWPAYALTFAPLAGAAGTPDAFHQILIATATKNGDAFNSASEGIISIAGTGSTSIPCPGDHPAHATACVSVLKPLSGDPLQITATLNPATEGHPNIERQATVEPGGACHFQIGSLALTSDALGTNIQAVTGVASGSEAASHPSCGTPSGLHSKVQVRYGCGVTQSPDQLELTQSIGTLTTVPEATSGVQVSGAFTRTAEHSCKATASATDEEFQIEGVTYHLTGSASATIREKGTLTCTYKVASLAQAPEGTTQIKVTATTAVQESNRDDTIPEAIQCPATDSASINAALLTWTNGCQAAAPVVEVEAAAPAPADGTTAAPEAEADAADATAAASDVVSGAGTTATETASTAQTHTVNRTLTVAKPAGESCSVKAKFKDGQNEVFTDPPRMDVVFAADEQTIEVAAPEPKVCEYEINVQSSGEDRNLSCASSLTAETSNDSGCPSIADVSANATYQWSARGCTETASSDDDDDAESSGPSLSELRGATPSEAGATRGSSEDRERAPSSGEVVSTESTYSFERTGYSICTTTVNFQRETRVFAGFRIDIDNQDRCTWDQLDRPVDTPDVEDDEPIDVPIIQQNKSGGQKISPALRPIPSIRMNRTGPWR